MKKKMIKKVLIFIVPIFFGFSLLIFAIIGSAYNEYVGILIHSENSENAEVGEIQAGVIKGKRTAYPSSDNHFFFSSKYNPFVGTAYGPPATSHNCTWYAFGRFSEILGKRAALPTGNAGTWYENCTAYKKGRTPKIGAVVVWKYSTGGAGHVAVVEEIKPNGDIVTSNSGWSGANFWMETWASRKGYQGGKYILQGFIYQP